MIDRSNAYKKLKKQIQDSIDFVVLCCHAVPALKGYIKAVEKGSAEKIPDPDIFVSPTEYERLKEISPSYRKMLGKFLILSSFSYFEAYITDVLDEIFEFHGGDSFIELATRKRDETFGISENKISKRVRKLRDRKKKGKERKYSKLNLELNSLGYRFPSDLFSSYGLIHLKSQISEMRAYQIPDVVQHALGINMSEADVNNFHRIRDLRNDIAHGKTNKVDLSKAIDDNRFLRGLAIKIDKHVVKHFFVIEV